MALKRPNQPRLVIAMGKIAGNLALIVAALVFYLSRYGALTPAPGGSSYAITVSGKTIYANLLECILLYGGFLLGFVFGLIYVVTYFTAKKPQ